jgi:hypothetical protein
MDAALNELEMVEELIMKTRSKCLALHIRLATPVHLMTPRLFDGLHAENGMLLKDLEIRRDELRPLLGLPPFP